MIIIITSESNRTIKNNGPKRKDLITDQNENKFIE